MSGLVACHRHCYCFLRFPIQILSVRVAALPIRSCSPLVAVLGLEHATVAAAGDGTARTVRCAWMCEMVSLMGEDLLRYMEIVGGSGGWARMVFVMGIEIDGIKSKGA
jgi:hypothetical protein